MIYSASKLAWKGGVNCFQISWSVFRPNLPKSIIILEEKRKGERKEERRKKKERILLMERETMRKRPSPDYRKELRGHRHRLRNRHHPPDGLNMTMTGGMPRWEKLPADMMIFMSKQRNGAAH